MKTNNVMQTIRNADSFCDAGSAELRSVEGGLIGLLVGIGLAKLNDYLVKLATEPDYMDIPIEPLT